MSLRNLAALLTLTACTACIAPADSVPVTRGTPPAVHEGVIYVASTTSQDTDSEDIWGLFFGGPTQLFAYGDFEVEQCYWVHRDDLADRQVFDPVGAISASVDVAGTPFTLEQYDDQAWFAEPRDDYGLKAGAQVTVNQGATTLPKPMSSSGTYAQLDRATRDGVLRLRWDPSTTGDIVAVFTVVGGADWLSCRLEDDGGADIEWPLLLDGMALDVDIARVNHQTVTVDGQKTLLHVANGWYESPLGQLEHWIGGRVAL